MSSKIWDFCLVLVRTWCDYPIVCWVIKSDSLTTLWPQKLHEAVRNDHHMQVNMQAVYAMQPESSQFREALGALELKLQNRIENNMF